jgi:hypothetical protein
VRKEMRIQAENRVHSIYVVDDENRLKALSQKDSINYIDKTHQ